MDGTISRGFVLGAGLAGLAAPVPVAADKRMRTVNESAEDPRLRFANVPNRTVMTAETMHRRGPIRTEPDSRRDRFRENVRGRAGS